ncbi:MAG: hypothetical protein AAFY64_07305 [Pseudomonadota bacterium]
MSRKDYRSHGWVALGLAALVAPCIVSVVAKATDDRPSLLKRQTPPPVIREDEPDDSSNKGRKPARSQRTQRRITIIGRVQRRGGSLCHQIRTAQGETYALSYLPERIATGVRVRVIGMTQLIGSCMAGQMIAVQTIEKLPAR